MRAAWLVVVLAVGCSKKTGELEATNWCADELTKTVAPQLEQTLDGGDADAFHRATDKFTQGTMCGPDFAGVVHDWEQSLRDPDAAKGNAQRHALVARLGDLMSGSDNDWSPERKALSNLFAKAK